MNNLNFDDGYREFSINNDESRVVRFNPSDYAIFARLAEAKKKIGEAFEKAGDVDITPEGKAVDFEVAGKRIDELDKIIKEQMNYVFNSEVADKIFGNQSPLSNIGGKSLFERVFECIEPILLDAMTESKKERKKKIEKYTKGVK